MDMMTLVSQTKISDIHVCFNSMASVLVTSAVFFYFNVGDKVLPIDVDDTAETAPVDGLNSLYRSSSKLHKYIMKYIMKCVINFDYYNGKINFLN